MASEGSDEAGAQPNLNLTTEERHVYGQLFRQADSDNAGIVMGEVAVKFFEKTRLDSRLLGEIWQIADKENRGFLTPAGFGIALRLIGHAQAGREPSAALAFQPGPIPRFEGVAAPLVPNATGVAGAGAGLAQAPTLVAQGTGGAGARVPPLAVDKAAQYAKLFQDQVRGGSVLPGDRAKRIFERSGLNNEILGRIWQLADTEQRGALVQTEFIIAMHLLTSTKLGALRAMPTVLPAALYEAATRGTVAAASGGAAPPAAGPGSPVRQQSPLGAGAGILPPPPTIQRQLTGQRLAPQFTGSMVRPAPPVAMTPNTTGGIGGLGGGGASDWLITPAEKARMEPVFDSLDKTKKGYITGEEAVPFLMRSGLSEDALAQIWDLADVNSEGRLTSDTFAVALYLIQQQRQRTDGSSAIPAKLPPNLVPPSMRGQALPGSPVAVQQQQPPPPPPAQPKSALDDLFGLDSGSSSAPAVPALAPASTGGPIPSSMSDPFMSSSSPVAPSSPSRASPPVTSSFKPFVPSSSFGRSLTAQVTGDSSGSAPSSFPKPAAAAAAASSAQNDLLSSDNDEASRNLSSDTAELANLSNQIGSLSKHMQDVQTHRSTLQTELSQTSTQKKNFEQRLAQLRTLYEKEARDVRTLEEQLKTSRTDTKKLQTEVAALTATCQDLQNQHQQVSAALQADRQENTSLKERITAVTAEVNQLKPQIEKLKSEARQQKGIVAINRKQLSLGESDRDKLKTEVGDLTRQNEELSREIQNAAATSSAAASASASSNNASPSVASSSGRNPFFQRTASSDLTSVFSSSAHAAGPSTSSSKTIGETSFDDIFGPAPTTTTNAAAASPPPVNSNSPAPPPASTPSPAPVAAPAAAAAAAAAFQAQTTGASDGSGTSSVYTAPTSATATPAATSRQPTFAADSFPGFSGPQPSSAAATDGASTVTPAESTPVASSYSPSSAPAAVAAETTAASKEEGASPSAGAGAAAAVTAGVVGAAGVAGVAALAATPSSADGGKKESVWSPGHVMTDSLNDPFSTLDQQQDKAKEDFESAFASFKASRAASTSPAADIDEAFATTSKAAPADSSKDDDPIKTDTAKAISSFNTEFPPISELNPDDDDSDSDSGGFDDDFAPASPKLSHTAKTEQPLPADTTTTAATAAAAAAPIASEGNGEATTAKQPPSPVLAKATAPSTTATSSDVFSSTPAASSLDDIFSVPTSSAPFTAAAAAAATTAAVSSSAPIGTAATTATTTAKAPASDFDDLDDEFADLEDAKEGSADDDFANISRSGTDAFTSAFDSSPAPSQPSKMDSSFGVDSSFDFGSFGTSTATQNGSSVTNSKAPGGGGGAAAAASDSSHDWFSFATTTPTAAAAAADESKAAAPATTSAGAAGASSAGADSATRPAGPGRLLTEEGEHDDPILKKLTSMGYPRAVALNALEKYDYNVDRAANYLASQS